MAEDIFSEFPEEVRKSWKIHTSFFGPILEPAFVDDIPTRIQLTAALNHISNRNTQRGIDILNEIEERCICDDDRCAWLFCMALAYEMTFDRERTVSYYYQCCQYSPDFYLPYLKIAKSAHTNQSFALAAEFYQKALEIVSEYDITNDQQISVVAASAASNLASCYTMMHDYQNAEKMIDYSTAILPVFPGRNGTYAVLYAACGKAEKAKMHLELLKKENISVYTLTEPVVRQTLNGEHPQFHAIPPITAHLSVFWTDFTSKESKFREQLDNNIDKPICEYISEIMTKAFPCMQKKLRVRASKTDNGYLVELSDYFTVTMMEGYKNLIADMPSELMQNWNFISVHD